MSRATLTINSRNYGAWSLRGWLMCKIVGLDFDERVVDSDDPAADGFEPAGYLVVDLRGISDGDEAPAGAVHVVEEPAVDLSLGKELPGLW